MSISFKTGLVALGLTALAGTAVAAPAPKAVVELFTSQGCSSCPPADALLRELSRRPDVIALTLPVDYWDYLGWRDTLARPAFSARQRAYAAARGDRQVFTPQMVVNGTLPQVGSDRARLEQTLALGPGGHEALPVAISVAEKGEEVAISVGSAADGEVATADLWLLPVAKAREIAIGRGENHGRTMTYANVVRGITRIGEWRGEAKTFTVPSSLAHADDAEGYVVLLQAADGSKPGAILGAVKSPGL